MFMLATEYYIMMCTTLYSFQIISAFYDSLKDPMTGRPAVVVSPDALAPLLDSGTVAILRQPGPAALSELAEGPVPFRLIPYHTVSSGCELMAAFTPHGVWVDGKPVKAVVAVAPRSVSDGGAYSALLSV